MNRIFEAIPELSEKLYNKMYLSSKILADYKGGFEKQVIVLVIKYLSMMLGGHKKFWENETSKVYVLACWHSSLKFLTAGQVFNALYSIMTGGADVRDYSGVPTTPVEFFKIAKSGSHNRTVPNIEETSLMLMDSSSTNKRKMSAEEITLHIKKIKEMLPNSKSKNIQNSNQPTQEELNRVYDESRNKKTLFCDVHRMSFYTDLGCGECKNISI